MTVKRKKLLIFLIFLAVLAGIIINPLRLYDILRVNYSKNIIYTDADGLTKEFEENEDAALKKYKGRIVQITGKIAGTEQPKEPLYMIYSLPLLLEEDKSIVHLGEESRYFRGLLRISCHFDKVETSRLKVGDRITIRGKFVGLLYEKAITFRRSKIIEVIPIIPNGTIAEIRDNLFDFFNKYIQNSREEMRGPFYTSYLYGASLTCLVGMYGTIADNPDRVAERAALWISVSLLQMEYGIIYSNHLAKTQEALEAYNPDTINLTETDKEELAGMIKEFQEKLPAVKIVSRDAEILPKEETKHLWGRPFKMW